MVFSSLLFVFGFLPCALALYYLTPRGGKNLVLTAVSYAFYGWANPNFLVLIAWATLVDYCCGNLISGYWAPFGRGPAAAEGKPHAPAAQRKFFVAVSLASNLGLLFFFKYFVFAQENFNSLLRLAGRGPLPVLQVLLPVGISFYTFESISYTLDIYSGRAQPALAWVLKSSALGGGRLPWWRRVGMELRALNAFACYITQFPHLVAGPIIRYQDLETQLHFRTHTLEKFAAGVFFFAFGLAKKVLIANPAGAVADAAFGTPRLPWVDSWYGLFGYAFQIYFDFSGYTDMAIGLGLMFGFEFAKNFASPYKSQSLTEFWRRWHISLSTWLRDYLYIPLGGNRRGPLRTYVNLITVMALGGLWHGASWNFLIWGLIHGGWLAFERVLDKTSLYARAPAALRVAVTFAIVCLAWVFFRARDLPSAVGFTASLFGLGGEAPPAALLVRGVLYSPDHVAWMLAAFAVAFFGIETWDFAGRITPAKAALALLLLVYSVVVMSTQAVNPFLYFQF